MVATEYKHIGLEICFFFKKSHLFKFASKELKSIELSYSFSSSSVGAK